MKLFIWDFHDVLDGILAQNKSSEIVQSLPHLIHSYSIYAIKKWIQDIEQVLSIGKV
jgi:hypothetical protein